MSLLLISSERFAEHVTPPGHVERVERAHVLEATAIAWRDRGGAVAAPRPATRDELLAVHNAAYVDAIAQTAGRAVMLDPDTYTSPESYEIALLAAGAVCAGVEHAIARGTGEPADIDRASQRISSHLAPSHLAPSAPPAADGGTPALALVRPPGHHAERDRAMGFCLFNNVAIGAAAALARGLSRVAIVDFDVHHGNGTQHAFERDPRVLFISLHQYPFWPGTGAATEIGQGDGRGFTVNVPLAAGCGDADYDLVFRAIVNPLLAEFAPELLLVSAGFDASARDPLASMHVSTAGFRRMVDYLWTAASTVADGRLVAVTEGGYDLQGLGQGLDQTVQALAAPARLPEPLPPDTLAAAARGRAAVNDVRAALAPCWPGL